jgi:hypothetical protein
MGPMALFDKSFLQSISTDEAVWFDHFFLSIICPVFYVETLGNLAKEVTKRTPEDIVRDIANKFPEWAGSPCAFHGDLVVRDLLGDHTAMRYQIPRPGARMVQSGVVFDQSPEEEAFSRWREGRFREAERIAASAWRKTLDELDLVSVQKELRAIGFTRKVCKTLEDAKTIADALVAAPNDPYAQLALVMQFFHIPMHLHPSIAERWQRSPRQKLSDFAPYAAYALTVEIFFQVALGAGLIGGERPSNRTDIAYLFYLPFCMILISSDDLHRRTAPLFQRKDQSFVWGIDLKADLKSINTHYLQLPESERDNGILSFAKSPPEGSMVADLWDRFMRKGIREEKPVKMSPDAEAALVAKLKAFSRQPTLSSAERVPPGEPEMMSIHRSVRHRRGSWWQLPKDYKEPPDEG